MSTLSNLLHRFCTCCYKPAVGDSSELTAGRQEPDTSIQDLLPQGPLEQGPLQQEPLPQEQLHPIPWKGITSSPVDMTGVEACNSVVRRPEDIEQSDLHYVPWSGVKKGPEEWGGDVNDPASNWSLTKNLKEEKETESLPLPWEAIFRQGPVPFDGKTTGPSWRETPVQNFVREMESQIPEIGPIQLNKPSETESDNASNSQKSSKNKTSTGKDKLSSDSPDNSKVKNTITQENTSSSSSNSAIEGTVKEQPTTTQNIKRKSSE